MARDYQRQRVYDWENWVARRTEQADQEAHYSLKDIEREIKPMLAYYGIHKTVEVKDGRGRRSACAWGDDAISMPRWSRKNWVIAHEIAHVIVSYHFNRFDRGQKALTSHGSVFVGVYIELLRKFYGFEEQWLRDTAKLGKVRNCSVLPKEIADLKRRYENA